MAEDSSSPQFSPRFIEAVGQALETPGDRLAWARADEALRAGESANGVDAQGVSAIHLAAQRKDADAVRELVKRGADADLPSFIEGETPLLFCSFFLESDQGERAAECIKALCESGANPNVVGASGRSVVAEFFLHHPLLAAEALFQAGARLDAVDSKKRNLAHFWGRERQLQNPQTLADALARLDWLRDRSFSQGAPIGLNAWDADGLSPLGVVLAGRQPSLALALILREADPLRAASPEKLVDLWKNAGDLCDFWHFPAQTREAVSTLLERVEIQAAMSEQKASFAPKTKAARL